MRAGSDVLALGVLLAVLSACSSEADAPAACGDGVVSGTESCDDHNTNAGDGCSATCEREPGWRYSAATNGGQEATAICGDGLIVCGEGCDDGNPGDGDGCSASCRIEAGWECSGAPSHCQRLAARSRTPPVLGAPITGLPPGRWSPVEFPDTTCGDGSPAGVFISPGGPDLIVNLNGGFFCNLGYSDCESIASHNGLGPWTRQDPQYDTLSAFNSETFWNGTIFDRSDPNNVFRDFTYVFVPFCTADLHAGNAVRTLTQDTQSMTVHFTGHTNLVAFLRRIAATWPHPGRVVVAGQSSGAFGALLNYDTFRLFWPDEEMVLVSDSGPFLELRPASSQSWDATWALWNVAPTIDEICPGCPPLPTELYSSLERWYPSDRKSIVTYAEDSVLPSGNIYEGDGPTFTQAVLDTAASVLGPSRWAWYIAPARGHVLLTNHCSYCDGPPLSSFTSAGVGLQDFLRAQVDDEPRWCPVTPALP